MDITKRLRDLGYGGATIDEAVAEIEKLRARIAELEARLEIDHVFVGPDMVREEVPLGERDGMIDGIAARDTTIRAQEQDLERLRAHFAKLEADNKTLRKRLSELAADYLSRHYHDASTDSRDKMMAELILITSEPDCWSFNVVARAHDLIAALEANRPEP